MCLKNFGWSSVIVQEAENKTIPKKKKSKKAKWLSEEALQIAKERREAKSKGERERYIQLNADFQRKARETRQAFFNEQCIKLQENRRGKPRDLFRKTGDIKGTFCPKMGTIKDINRRDLVDAEEIKESWKELHKKDPNEPDDNGVLSHPEPAILESEDKWALGSTAVNKASGCYGIPVELFKSLKDGAIEVLH